MRRAVVATALISVVVLAGCGGDDGSSGDAASGDPVRIGLIAQEEELIAYPEMRAGAEAGAAYVNNELDGVSGRPLEVEVCTTGDTPESAVKCAQQFANDDSIQLVLVGTLNSAAANPVLAKADKPALTITNEPTDQITPGVWSFDPGAIVLASGLMKFAADDLGAKTYTLLVPDDPFYTEVVVGLAQALGESYGIKPADNAVVVPLKGDPTGAVTEAKDQRGDVMIVISNGPLCIPIAESVKTLGVDTPVVAADTCLVPDAIKSGALDGFYAISVNQAPVDPELREDDGTYAKIVDEYGGGDELLNSSFGGWAVGNVIVAADVLTKAGAEATPEEIDAVLADGYDIELPTYPPASCPGPGAWKGACVRSTTIVKIDEGQAAPETIVDTDMNDLNFLLEG